MAVEVYGYIVVKFPYSIHRISDMHNPTIRNAILNMQEGDILNIKGIGSLMVVGFDLEKKSRKELEVRELYITTMPA